MTGSVTRTISVAFIILELNGHLSHSVPTAFCVLASYATSEMIKSQSFFDMLSVFSGLDLRIAALERVDLENQGPDAADEIAALEMVDLENQGPVAADEIAANARVDQEN